MLNYTKLAKAITKIARQAGETILDVYNNASDIEISSKADDSPLTLADRKANTVICDGLEKLEEQFPIVSEENKEIPYEVRKDFDYYWLVDPLDGTKEFIKRNGEFTVNIALIQSNRVVFGVVYAPCLDEMYWAADGCGAFCEKDGKTEKLDAATFTMQDKGLNIVCSRSHLNAETQAFVDKLVSPSLVAKGSSLKFLILAVGGAHLYPRIAPTMEWDTAAAQIILEEAGGKVLHYETRKPLHYNKPNLLNPNFLAHGCLRD